MAARSNAKAAVPAAAKAAAKPKPAARKKPAPAAPPVDLAPAPRPSLVLLGLTGAAAALDAADKCGPTCRWPKGHPREANFTFCGAPVTTRTVGERGRERPNFYCEEHRAEARGSRQPAVKSPSTAELGYAARLGAPRAVGATSARFGGAS